MKHPLHILIASESERKSHFFNSKLFSYDLTRIIILKIKLHISGTCTSVTENFVFNTGYKNPHIEVICRKF